MALMDTIQEDIKTAMRAGQAEKLTVQTLRMLKNHLLMLGKAKGADQDAPITDQQVIDSVGKMVKQRRESIKQFTDAGRADLAEQEQLEIDILAHYLPEQLSDDEVMAIVKDAIAKSGAENMKDMGKVMGIITPQVKGRADVGAISQLVKQELA